MANSIVSKQLKQRTAVREAKHRFKKGDQVARLIVLQMVGRPITCKSAPPINNPLLGLVGIVSCRIAINLCAENSHDVYGCFW